MRTFRIGVSELGCLNWMLKELAQDRIQCGKLRYQQCGSFGIFCYTVHGGIHL
jgi:hypothetical protein